MSVLADLGSTILPAAAGFIAGLVSGKPAVRGVIAVLLEAGGRALLKRKARGDARRADEEA